MSKSTIPLWIKPLKVRYSQFADFYFCTTGTNGLRTRSRFLRRLRPHLTRSLLKERDRCHLKRLKNQPQLLYRPCIVNQMLMKTNPTPNPLSPPSHSLSLSLCRLNKLGRLRYTHKLLGGTILPVQITVMWYYSIAEGQTQLQSS